MEKYIVYKHTVRDTQQSYIGYTKRTMAHRLKQHTHLAYNGSTTYFHRAIKRYGVASIISEVLWSGSDMLEAQQMEKQYISQYNTVAPNGYNLSVGGTGGDFTVGWTDAQRKQHAIRKSAISHGVNNIRYSGFTDEQIVEQAVQFYIDSDYHWCHSTWIKFSKVINMPQSYNPGGFRYGGHGMVGFMKLLKESLVNIGVLNHDEHIQRWSKQYADQYIDKIRVLRTWYHCDELRQCVLITSDETLDFTKWVLGYKKYKEPRTVAKYKHSKKRPPVFWYHCDELEQDAYMSETILNERSKTHLWIRGKKYGNKN